jgi:hypothetical protein
VGGGEGTQGGEESGEKLNTEIKKIVVIFSSMSVSNLFKNTRYMLSTMPVSIC